MSSKWPVRPDHPWGHVVTNRQLCDQRIPIKWDEGGPLAAAGGRPVCPIYFSPPSKFTLAQAESTYDPRHQQEAGEGEVKHSEERCQGLDQAPKYILVPKEPDERKASDAKLREQSSEKSFSEDETSQGNFAPAE